MIEKAIDTRRSSVSNDVLGILQSGQRCECGEQATCVVRHYGVAFPCCGSDACRHAMDLDARVRELRAERDRANRPREAR